MKRVLPVLALTVVGLVPLWRYAPATGTTAPTEAARPVGPAPSPDGPSDGTSGGSTDGSMDGSSGGTPAPGPSVFAGSLVHTEKGPVQVEVTFAGEEITAVRMLTQPDHPQTTAAVPRLIEDTLTAQSADIDTVSGATVTSEGYKESLQAALDAKGI
ncbi:FMN-binding protein [Streptomyces sp. NPDC091377]|uniref:FMN-binding protein n=1 Tax=Streptomyces sp. NPDC091377 TaxID=3365995 RepID=UPI0037F3FAFB